MDRSHAAKQTVEPGQLVVEPGGFLLGQELELTLLLAPLELLQPANPLLDRLVIRQHPAQPALVHERHPSPRRFFLNRLLRLLLRADEQYVAALARDVADEAHRL